MKQLVFYFFPKSLLSGCKSRSIWAIILLTTALAACKKKEDPAPYPGIEQLAGKWKLVAYEIVQERDTVWKEAERNGSYDIMFRFEGVILDPEGMPACCTHSYYFINGVRFDVVPGAPLKSNPMCSLVDCWPCGEANYDPQEDGSLVYYCGPSGLKLKYERP
ncbi:MAG: hypothetical protein ABS46_02090 [Cytophagaceae bacterium SCN 52-12]|nr:MAG: hypothetical protein ABS46_02090 [Cytophagaceae bacterium SCN 52-12]